MNAQAAKEREERIVVRAAAKEDMPFVFSTWLNHFHSNSYATKRIPNGVYFRHHHAIAERIVNREGTRVLVAALAEDQAIILGYLVLERQGDQPVIHFVFVKKPWQCMGIATQLVAAANLPTSLAGVAYTHPTFLWWQHLERRFPKSIYNPYLA